jgi:hypothetical protein
MPADIVHEDNPALARIDRKTTPAAALAALGIVYGDLGTSPLYTLQAVVGATGGHFSPEAALGSLSLIFWALIITISVKYCLFVMRADNHGEGGILALMSMTSANWSEGRRTLIVMGLFGAALRLARRRHNVAPSRRTVQVHDWHQHGSRALSRQCAGPDRSSGRTGAAWFRHHACVDRVHQSG